MNARWLLLGLTVGLFIGLLLLLLGGLVFEGRPLGWLGARTA